jgi:glycosyltransferase involved in cell wall biosynthesis
MKILVSTFGGDGGKSGISRYILNLLDEFQKLNTDHQFDVITYDDEREIFCPNNRHHAITLPSSLRSPLRNIAWNLSSMGKLCKKTKADVLFLPAANRRVAWTAPCPMVGTVHDFSSLHVTGKYDWKRGFYIKKILPALVRRLDHVITISESSKKDILDYAHYPEDKITITSLAADSAHYHPRNKTEDQKAIWDNLQFKAPYIVYISRLEHPGKNHVALIKAFEKVLQEENLPHYLVLAGSDWNGAEVVHQTAENSPFSSRIIFTGFIEDALLPKLYGGADALVFPSLYEGFGLPVLEALACGIPTACSNTSSMPEVAGDAALLFDPYKIDEIANCIKKIIKDPELADSLSKAGIARAAQFSWKKTAQMTLKVLEQTGKQTSH